MRFYAAGHSLGGGLAQNVFYRYPEDFWQVYAFDSSPVTGYADNDPSEKKSSCDCRMDELGGEVRVYRIYETDEVLAFFRGPLKLINPLSRHIQEVRFSFDVNHSISGLAKGMIDNAGADSLRGRTAWWLGRDEEDGRICTALFNERLEESCNKPNEKSYCPN